MGVQYPGFVPNVEATLGSLKRKSKFLDVAPNSTVLVRALPTSAMTKGGQPTLFYATVNHFKLRPLDGGPGGIALACLEEHGTDATGTKCFLCEAYEALKNGDTAQQEIAKKIKPSPKFYFQVIQAEKNADGVFTWSGPIMMGVNGKTANKIGAKLETLKFASQPPFTDPEKGQGILITRTGSGFQTNYEVELDGNKVALNELMPDWVERYVSDYRTYMDLKVYAPDVQREYLENTFGKEKLGLEI